MGDNLNLNGRASHSRLIQLLGEIESRLEPGLAYCSLDEFQQWADENLINDEGFWDTLNSAVRYCDLDAHFSQMISIPLNEIGERAQALLDASYETDDSTEVSDDAIEAYGTLRALYGFVRGYRVELEYKASDGNVAPQVNHNGQAFSTNGKVRAKGKPGRKSDPEGDRAIADDFAKGCASGQWDSQADYLRKKYPDKWKKNKKAAHSWLSTVLERDKKLNNSGPV